MTTNDFFKQTVPIDSPLVSLPLFSVITRIGGETDLASGLLGGSGGGGELGAKYGGGRCVLDGGEFTSFCVSTLVLIPPPHLLHNENLDFLFLIKLGNFSE